MAWQIPVGADISGEGETSADDTFNAKFLDTLFFYPTKADYAKAVKSTQLQEYLQGANYPSVCKYLCVIRLLLLVLLQKCFYTWRLRMTLGFP